MKRPGSFAGFKPQRQSGSFILEALISVLIFSIGLIALVGISSQAINFVGQTKIRNDASNLAGELIGEMWVSAATPVSFNTAPWTARVQNFIPAATASVGTSTTPISINGAACPSTAIPEPSIVTNEICILITWPDKKDASITHQYSTAANIGKN